MEPLVYVHDIRDNSEGLAGANLGNTDLISDIEAYLDASPGAVLTADDGYRSVKRLVPLLERTGSRLILFLNTGFLDREVFPYEVSISNMLAEMRTINVFGEIFDFAKDGSTRQEAFSRVHNSLKPLPQNARVEVVAQFFRENGKSLKMYENDVFLNWTEASELALHPLIDIGSHGHSHLHLPNVEITEQFREIFISRRRLARRLQVPIPFFAYPYGSHNSRTRLFARLSGYRRAYSTAASGENSFAWPRLSLADALKKVTL